MLANVNAKVRKLKLMRSLLARRENWTKLHHASTARGEWCGIFDRDATAWSIFGALWRVDRDVPELDDVDCRPFIVMAIANEDKWQDRLAEWNATKSIIHPMIRVNGLKDTTHEDVIRILDRAISYAESQHVTSD